MTTTTTHTYRLALAAAVNTASAASRHIALRDLIEACARGMGFVLPNGRVCCSPYKAAAAWRGEGLRSKPCPPGRRSAGDAGSDETTTRRATMNTERTATEIEALTPGQAWDAYVGSDSPNDYSANDVTRYVHESPLCKGLDGAARDALEAKLQAMR